jgi:hypothetical protein
MIDCITIAILAKDKAHTLPLYLRCIEQLDWPKDRICLYVRTNNNNDSTCDVLQAWLRHVGSLYREVFFNASDVAVRVQDYKPHEWNVERFRVLSQIRNDSIDWAYDHQTHYFVADCDNFIRPETLRAIVDTQLPIVAPLLRATTRYSNFHAAINPDGYFAECPLYHDLLDSKIRGLVEVPVVHCTYYIRHDVNPRLTYNDDSDRYEYVMFSASARKEGIPQYLDTRQFYGRITFAENSSELMAEPWIKEFV